MKYEVLAHMKGETKRGPVESDITRNVEFTEAAGPLETPDGVKKLLDGQS